MASSGWSSTIVIPECKDWGTDGETEVLGCGVVVELAWFATRYLLPFEKHVSLEV